MKNDVTIFNLLDKPYINLMLPPLSIPRTHPHRPKKERINPDVLSQLHRIFAFVFGLLSNIHEYNIKLVEKI